MARTPFLGTGARTSRARSAELSDVFIFTLFNQIGMPVRLHG
jgi:hypothetical protein